MTNYSKIKNCLEDAEKPLNAQEISRRTGVNSRSVYRIVKKMRERKKVFADEDYDEGYSISYILRE